MPRPLPVSNPARAFPRLLFDSQLAGSRFKSTNFPIRECEMRARNLCIAVFVLLFVARLCPAQEITVAAAADLQFAFQDVAARFQKDTGKQVKLIFGSSGNFFAQIQNGAPFDLFFSADIDYPRKLEAAGLAEPGTLYPYATGKIVLWAPNESKLDLSRGLQVLLDPSI